MAKIWENSKFMYNISLIQIVDSLKILKNSCRTYNNGLHNNYGYVSYIITYI